MLKVLISIVIFVQVCRVAKAELPKVGFFSLSISFHGNFLLIKMLEIQKTKNTHHTTFKTDIIKVVLVFSISSLFTNKNSQGRKLSAV